MNYIVVSNYGIPSIKSIFDNFDDVKIIKKFDSGWRRLTDSINSSLIWSKITTPVFNSSDKILRWGATTVINPEGAIVYNKSASIQIASNKYVARITMEESGVPIPDTFAYEDNQDGIHSYSEVDDGGDLIERPYKHSKGRNFVLLTSGTRYNGKIGHYYSKVYNKQREVRVHVAHGKVLSVQEKPLVEGVVQANQAVTQESWRVIPWSEYEKDVCKIACDAVKSLGLDSGAVDVMVDRRNSEMPVCVCEVNTAPSLDSSPYDQSRYSKYINWLFRSETKREWFDYEEWNRPSSFAFKNFQLGE